MEMGMSSEGAAIEQHRRLGVEDFGSFLDKVLFLIGRSWEIIVIVACIGILVVLRKPLANCVGKNFQKVRAKCRLLCRCRTLKRCCAFMMSFGKSSSGASQGHDFAKLADAQQTLTVTFLRCSGIKRRLDFYFEGWTEPQETTNKNTSRFSGRETVDTRQDHMRFDWFGDEDELVLHACEFTSPILPHNVSIGEVRIPRAHVIKYAQEAMNDPANLTAGTRSFDVKRIEGDEQKRLAEARKKHVGAGQDIMRQAVSMAAESKFGNFDEVERLRKENMELKGQLAFVSQSSGVQAKKPAPLMKVLVRFEIAPRRESNASAIFRSSSFDTQQNSTNYP
eukprot:TRINITY_DN8064_c0_g1_i1.p1 TRINITY_DN8064_c0_g1~~TRINITY_DN8064_c0_g1_i1.p1  ORF type:complete len:336 (+),score=67.55 TRINITY_DN8064_c0_g1_i1:181-1188(+)